MLTIEVIVGHNGHVACDIARGVSSLCFVHMAILIRSYFQVRRQSTGIRHNRDKEKIRKSIHIGDRAKGNG